jgi:hypothetical protein
VLKGHNLLKIIETQEGRLSTVPGKIDRRTGKGFDVLDNIFFQHGIGHAKSLLGGIEVLLLQVVTIVTTQVAEGTNRFGEDLKFTRGFAQGSAPHLPTKSD